MASQGSSKMTGSTRSGKGARSAPTKQTTHHSSAQEVPFPLFSDGVVELEMHGKIKKVPWFTDELQQKAVNSIHEYLRVDKNRTFSKGDVGRLKKGMEPRPLADSSRDAVVQMHEWLDVWIEFYTQVGDEAKVQKVIELQAPLVYQASENTGPSHRSNNNGMRSAARRPKAEVRTPMITVTDEAIDATKEFQQLLASSTTNPTAGPEKKKRAQGQQKEKDVQARASVESPNLQTPNRSNPHSQRMSKSSHRAPRQPATTEKQLQDQKKRGNREAHSSTSVNPAPLSEKAVEQEAPIAQSPPLNLTRDRGSRGSPPPQRRTRTPKRKSELPSDREEPSKRARPAPRKQSPLTTSIHPNPTTSTEATSPPQSPHPPHLTDAQKRAQNVETYIQRFKALNKPDLATFISQAHNLSLSDQRTAKLIDTVLSREPTSAQIATLQTIFDDLKAEHAQQSHSNSATPEAPPSETETVQRVVKSGNRAKAIPVLKPPTTYTRGRAAPRRSQDMEWKPFVAGQTPQIHTQVQDQAKKAADTGPTWSDRYNPEHPAYIWGHANRPMDPSAPRSRGTMWKARKLAEKKAEREKRWREEVERGEWEVVDEEGDVVEEEEGVDGGEEGGEEGGGLASGEI